MIVEAQEVSITVKFESHDWRNGLAKSMNGVIKKLPYPTRKFDGEGKQWVITPTANNRRALRYAYSEWEVNQPPSERGIGAIEMDAPDVQEFLEQFN